MKRISNFESLLSKKGGEILEVSAETIFEIMETVQTVKEVVDVINENTDESELLSQELLDTLGTFTDDEQGNNDIESILLDIKNALYGYEDGSMTTVQSNLEVLNARLDSEFITLNDCLGFIATCLVSIFAWKILTWFYNLISR